MDSVKTRLDEIGYRGERSEPQCWSVMRFGEPESALAEHRRPRRRDPSRSRALASWLVRLIDRRHRPSPYQICLALHIATAESQLGRRPR